MSIGDYCRDVLRLNEGKSRQKNKKVFNKKIKHKMSFIYFDKYSCSSY